MLYAFEDFSLDTERRELRRGGALRCTQPQVFDVLQYLIDNREHVVSKDDLIDAVWQGRPAAPSDKAVPHAFNLAGESAESKRTRIAEEIKKSGADAAIVSLADSICWLLNVRGSDTPHTPFVLSYAILNSDGSVDWFVDPRRAANGVALYEFVIPAEQQQLLRDFKGHVEGEL